MIFQVSLDAKLTENFTLREAVEWAHLLTGTSDFDKERATSLAMAALDTQTLINIAHAADRQQDLRNHLNLLYPNENIYLLATSWLRHSQWEEYRGRDGTSQHTKGHAVDIVPVAETIELPQLLDDAEDFYMNLQGFTKRYPTFIHNDMRETLP